MKHAPFLVIAVVTVLFSNEVEAQGKRDISNKQVEATVIGESDTDRWARILDSTNGDNNPTTGCNSDRFQCIFGGAAVLDLETGLVWEKVWAETTHTWVAARDQCSDNKTVGGRKGWRLPSVHELASLVDPTVGGEPKLPPGHPFMSGALQAVYWSATESLDNSSTAWSVRFQNGNVEKDQNKTDPILVLCVRGGQNGGSQY